jgi:hypothetical protein
LKLARKTAYDYYQELLLCPLLFIGQCAARTPGVVGVVLWHDGWYTSRLKDRAFGLITAVP